MKILMINYEFPPLGTGGANQSFELARKFAKDHEVYFLTSGFTDFGISQIDGMTVEKIQTYRKRIEICTTWEMLKFLIRAWFRIPKIIKEFQPEVAHIFYVVPTGLLVFHPKFRNIPFIVTSFGSDVPGHNTSRFKVMYTIVKPLAKHIWRKANQIVANSTGLSEEIKTVLPSAVVDVIPSGIEITSLSLPPPKKEQAPFRLLFVGRLIPLKRVDLAIRAVAKVIQESFVPIEFRIVGSGDEELHLKMLARELGVESNVVFLGFISQAALFEEYRNAHLYVQLSTAEGMSISILEAMAFGLPIVTTMVGGSRELIHGNGVIVTSDLNEISKTILNLATNLPQCMLLGEESRKLASAFDFQNISAHYLGLFESAVHHA